MTTSEILPGAEPFAADGGVNGVLVLHGLTSTPQSMRGLGEALAAAGLTVEVPLLPGHGTTLDDLKATRWEDWCSAAELAFVELESRCDRVAVVGLSVGAMLGCWLAAHRPSLAALVVVNPFVEPPAEGFLDILRRTLEAGVETGPAVANDIAMPGSRELAYDGIPLASLLSVHEAQAELAPRLGDIGCPVLIMTSRQDHLVPTSSSDFLAERAGGPVERVWLERSYHVAPLDYD
ncbi:MAG TPA: alpha/beta fold hydrolase, partial [Acidimicrobiales bacterium]|nr:alpha/beta fold hydrolase [Acidimicrobiales bacterium]